MATYGEWIMKSALHRCITRWRRRVFLCSLHHGDHGRSQLDRCSGHGGVRCRCFYIRGHDR